MASEHVFRELWGDRPLAPTAQLTDGQIRTAIEELGVLIDRDEAYDPSHAAYASYEVHASGDVGGIDYLTAGEGLREHRTPAGPDRKIRIAPGATVRLFTQEFFELPADVYATVIGLGQLYAAGLTVGSTYVDPGTRNRIYLSVSNVSEAEVLIPVGFPIGRAQFYVLGEAASRLKRSTWRDIPYERGESHPRALISDLAAIEERILRVEQSLSQLEQASNAGVVASHGPDEADLAETALTLGEMKRRVTWLLWAVVLLFGSMIFFLLPDAFWLALNGEGLSPAARFAITALAPAAMVWVVARFVQSVRAHKK